MSIAESKLLTTERLVLSRFEISDNPQNGEYINIEGRGTGLFKFVGSKTGLANKTRFTVRRDTVELAGICTGGRVCGTVYTDSIASTACSFSKKPIILLTAVLLMLLGLYLVMPFIINGYETPTSYAGFASILFGILFLLVWRKAPIGIDIETYGGRIIRVEFERGYLQSQKIDMEFVGKAVTTLNSVVRASRSTSSHLPVSDGSVAISTECVMHNNVKSSVPPPLPRN